MSGPIDGFLASAHLFFFFSLSLSVYSLNSQTQMADIQKSVESLQSLSSQVDSVFTPNRAKVEHLSGYVINFIVGSFSSDDGAFIQIMPPFGKALVLARSAITAAAAHSADQYPIELCHSV